MEDDSILMSFDGPDELRLVYERDTRVAYAYVLDAGAICADVWLFNVSAPEGPPEWQLEGSSPPFVNPAEYAAPCDRDPAELESSLRCEWTAVDGGLSHRASLWSATLLLAAVAKGDKPGRSRFARVDGPLARVLDADRD